MRRIGFTVVLILALGLALTILSATNDAGAQQTIRYRIGVLTPGMPGISIPLEAFRRAKPLD